MGTTQTYGQSLIVKNDKKAIKLAEIVLQANSQLMVNIQVNFGSSCFPKLWNYAVIELRKSDVDHPLTVRRFFQNNLPLIDHELEQFEYNQMPNAFEFLEMSGQFSFLKAPFYLKNNNIEPFDEYGLSESIINNLSQSNYLFPHNPEYRELYKNSYKNIFSEIGLQNGAFKSVGIIDLPQNNPYLGINNYNQVQDIIAAFLETIKTYKLHQLVFVSENKLQAQMMALALEIMSKTCLSGYIEQNIKFQQELEEEKQIELENSNLQQIDLEQPKTPTKIIRIHPKQSLSFQNGHIHFASSAYFRGEQPITQESIMELPITDKTEFQKCVCNRNTVIRLDQTFCCYCRTNRRNFWTCEERACGRKYCCSCKSAVRSRFRCYKNHPLSYTEELIDQNCIQCLRTPQRINLGSWQCSKCSNFSICGNCYYNTYLGKQYQKTKTYYQILRITKPQLRQEIINDLVGQYLTTVNYEQLQNLD